MSPRIGRQGATAEEAVGEARALAAGNRNDDHWIDARGGQRHLNERSCCDTRMEMVVSRVGRHQQVDEGVGSEHNETVYADPGVLPTTRPTRGQYQRTQNPSTVASMRGRRRDFFFCDSSFSFFFITGMFGPPNHHHLARFNTSPAQQTGSSLRGNCRQIASPSPIKGAGCRTSVEHGRPPR